MMATSDMYAQSLATYKIKPKFLINELKNDPDKWPGIFTCKLLELRICNTKEKLMQLT